MIRRSPLTNPSRPLEVRWRAELRVGHFDRARLPSDNDMHATMLYLLGLDHEKLTCRYSGRDFRLTDLAGKVAKDIVA